MKEKEDPIVSVIGLGYVGLPLALAFGKKVTTYGFDANSDRISELKNGIERNNEEDLSGIGSSKIIFTDVKDDLRKANFHIVAVPTPIDSANQPDLSILKSASKTVGSILKLGDTVVFESTVFPGATEEICLPIIEKESGLALGEDFSLGYSPERINPGDKEHVLATIIKVVSGNNKESTDAIARVYELVCLAGIHKASNIKTAEAAKVIENTQRDINIALINELSLIFHRIGINTNDVLEAAGTKWNFLKFTPGLVGGHCIGVDPYYLVHKAEQLGYHSQVITAGRQVNDYMPEFVAKLTLESLIEAGKGVKGARILVMGLTFKENVNDVRNSKISETIKELRRLGVVVEAYDPFLNQKDLNDDFKGVELVSELKENYYDAVISATSHDAFKEIAEESILDLFKDQPIIVDVRGIYSGLLNRAGVIYKSL